EGGLKPLSVFSPFPLREGGWGVRSRGWGLPCSLVVGGYGLFLIPRGRGARVFRVRFRLRGFPRRLRRVVLPVRRGERRRVSVLVGRSVLHQREEGVLLRPRVGTRHLYAGPGAASGVVFRLVVQGEVHGVPGLLVAGLDLEFEPRLV